MLGYIADLIKIGHFKHLALNKKINGKFVKMIMNVKIISSVGTQMETTNY
jgi:hypothetical protein